MWKFLQRVLGGSSIYYDKLMKSRDPKVTITEDQIQEAKRILKPLIKKSYGLVEADRSSTTPQFFDLKKTTIPYYKTFLHPEYLLHVYLDSDQNAKHSSKIQLVIENKENQNIPNEFPSLPTWESLIHVDVLKHKEIVALEPDNPWTLYKKAKEELTGKAKKNQVAGYPQWIENDLNFRKIKENKFLLQMELETDKQIIYFFLNRDLQTVEHYVQNF
ncbi:hypothetical protein [Nonlabens agnitus]|uniref:Uncharacterized protein n=1 Tax=Nonlabens agnitus TaxID=870484 RepID=A0A2S9WT28_9FLAO|nr:hypothetical protein [Nonlabens agnitus]PRP66641.1 hypothetical protein BST86_05765 [Nonlabens agnitus]